MAAFEAIASTTLGSTNTAIEFTSIPGSYRHLQLRLTIRDTFSATAISGPFVRFNGDSGLNYSCYNINTNGASIFMDNFNPASYASPSTYPAGNAGAGVYATFVIDLADYASTNKHKAVRFISGYDNNGSGFVHFGGATWRNTAAITTIRIQAGNTFAVGSTLSLYGFRSS